jgi:hypothetical protein
MARFRDLKVGEKFSFIWSPDVVCEKVSMSCYRTPNGVTLKPVSDVFVIRE